MELDLLLNVLALVAAGTPVGYFAHKWLALRATTPPAAAPPTALAEGLSAASAPQYVDLRVDLAPETIDQIGAMLERVLDARHRAALQPVEPERRATMPLPPEARMAQQVTAAIERGADAIQRAVQENGGTISRATARQQAAAMLYTLDEPADWPGGR